LFSLKFVHENLVPRLQFEASFVMIGRKTRLLYYGEHGWANGKKCKHPASRPRCDCNNGQAPTRGVLNSPIPIMN